MQTEVPEYSFNVPCEETVFNFRVDGMLASARVDPTHATLRHMNTYTNDNQGVVIATSAVDSTFLVTVTAEYGNTYTLHRLEKPAGKATFASAGAGGVLIVRGSSGWAEKVIDD